MFYIGFLNLKNERFAHSLFLVSHVSKSLRSLTKNEWPWAIRSGRLPKMSDHEQIIFGQKKSASLRKRMREFQALKIRIVFVLYFKLLF